MSGVRKLSVVVGLVLVVVLFLGGCTDQGTKRSYTNAAYGFSLNPPSGWQIVENELPTIAAWFAPVNSSNVSLVVSSSVMLSEGLSLSVFADRVEENLSASGVNYTVVYRDWRTHRTGSAYEIVYSYEKDGMVERFKQVAVLRSRTVFLIVFSAPPALYIKYLGSVDACIDSFV